ncbi:MAG: hypothetical protein HN348_13845 [Proteobacteria bacterium]|nr:hypothetical protein [Pseudomonadota bacterium]
MLALLKQWWSRLLGWFRPVPELEDGSVNVMRRMQWEKLYNKYCNQVFLPADRERRWRQMRRKKEGGPLRTLNELERETPNLDDLQCLRDLVEEYAKPR